MKICFLVGTLGRGGAERQLIYMLRALQNARIETRVLGLTKGEPLENEVKSLGVEVEWIGSSANKIVRLKEIIGNLKKRPADVLQSAHFYTNIYTAAAGRILRQKNIGAIRNDLHSEIAANHFYGKWSLVLPDHLIANSELARQRALQKGIRAEKIDFVKNVVEVEIGNETREAIEKKSLNILFAGRLEKQKRPELFIELAARLRRNLPDAKLNFQMVGDGSLRPSLERLASNLGLTSGEISFLGVQKEMADIYRRADILALTSEHEGTPNVMLEAMAYGIPVIAAKVGGVPEILTEECGILVDESDFEGFVKGTIRLITNRDLRFDLGRCGRQYVADNHSLDYLQKRLTGIYGKLLEN